MLINGERGGALSFLDRGLHYGDGLFETIALRGGRPCRWERHFHRLRRGCERLRLPPPDAAQLAGEAVQCAAGVERGVLKLIVTRGCGGRGYNPTGASHPTRLWLRYPWPEHPAAWRREGVTVRICAQRLGRNEALAGLKHLNRLDQVLARGEWDDPALAEGLMLDGEENVIEGTMSNVFLIGEDRLVTPELRYCGVCGILRETILAQARKHGIATEVRPLGVQALIRAPGAFLCNSLIGVWPIRSIQGEQTLFHPGHALLAEVQRWVAAD
ncbi:MAG: aminodeoxychorismate lyase [Gammaproteobacteria bacterium]